MSKQTKPTSLDKVRNALTEHGWEFTVEDIQVRVPDYDKPYGRRSYQQKQVDGYRIKAKNGADYVDRGRYWLGGPFSFTVEFTANGAYLARNTSGDYPFYQGVTLAKVLDQIERQSKAALDAHKAEREAREAAEEQEEERKVAEAYAEAQQALTEAQNAVYTVLQDLGLTEKQATAVLIESQKDDNVFGRLTRAQQSKENAGEGLLPGLSYRSGTYVDGKKVSS